jgi:HAD superfamily hydrolase (TIGR01509 family)
MAGQDAAWGVIFDVDGTMVDNAAYHENAWIELGRRRNLPITRDYYYENIHARSNDAIVKTIFGDDVDPAFGETVAEEKEAIYRETYRPVLQPNPGLMPFIDSLLANGVPFAAASNSPMANVTMVLEELGVDGHFRGIFAQGPDMVGKPDPTILYAAADSMGVARDRCVVLEDSSSGFRCAENANMPYVVITCGADPDCLERARNARAFHRDYTTLTPDELKGYVNGKG